MSTTVTTVTTIDPVSLQSGQSSTSKSDFPLTLNTLPAELFTLSTLRSICVLTICLVAAHLDIGQVCDLSHKLQAQSESTGLLLDVGTGVLILVQVLHKMVQQMANAPPSTSDAALSAHRRRWTTTCASFSFSALGVVFHGSIDNEAVGPHRLYMPFFLVCGTIILYQTVCAIDEAIPIGTKKQILKQVPCFDVAQRAKVELLVFAILTLSVLSPLTMIAGYENLLNKYLLNGYVFLHLNMILQPLFRIGKVATGKAEIAMIQYVFYLAPVAFFTESCLIKYFGIDSHFFVHILALIVFTASIQL